MAKVKFNVRTYDKDTKTTYEPSDDFVEVSDAFAKRIKDYAKADEGREGWFEFPKGGRPAKEEKEKE